MAYNAYNLSVLAYANGFTLWHYTTTDADTVVDNIGYFNRAADMLRVGDMILANTDTASTPDAGIFLVNGKSGGVVDVANLTAVGASDTD